MHLPSGTPADYEVLGVPRDADAAAIKSAFRGLAKELHPDVNQAVSAASTHPR
jgi:molecular chaperone DnaJ